MKKLIVTADDVGLHPGMTLGALAAHERGIATAVSVAAVGRAFEHAVELLRQRPGLDVGVHLTLVGERPLSPPGEIGSLVDQDGAFLPGYPAFVRRYLLGRIEGGEVERELRLQIERLLGAGLRVVHANSHQHLHVLPRIFEVVLRLARDYRIPWVRIPQGPLAARRGTARAMQLALLDRLSRRARRRLGDSLAAPDRTIGILDAGHLTVERLRRELAHVEGVTELVCHPGWGNAALAAEYAWDYAWDEETAALQDPGLPGVLGETGIELTSFSDLIGA